MFDPTGRPWLKFGRLLRGHTSRLLVNVRNNGALPVSARLEMEQHEAFTVIAGSQVGSGAWRALLALPLAVQELSSSSKRWMLICGCSVTAPTMKHVQVVSCQCVATFVYPNLPYPPRPSLWSRGRRRRSRCSLRRALRECSPTRSRCTSSPTHLSSTGSPSRGSVCRWGARHARQDCLAGWKRLQAKTSTHAESRHVQSTAFA